MNARESAAGVRIAVEDPDQPEILDLLRAGEEYGAGLYPAESNHFLLPAALRAPGVYFHVARNGDGRALGTGALVVHGDWAEIKRMWVAPDARGRGVARAMLRALEAAAAAAGTRLLRLETGVRNDAALVLYERAGFKPRGPFGDYVPDPLSVFLEKPI